MDDIHAQSANGHTDDSAYKRAKLSKGTASSNLTEETPGIPTYRRLIASKDGRNKLFNTMLVYMDYFAFAWLYMVVGPTLPALQKIIRVDLQTSSWIFTCFALGYLIGCPFHGLLYGNINNVLLMTVFAFASGGFWILTPWCDNLWLMLLVRILGGIVWGGTDSACHSQLFEIWGAETGPWVQLLYLLIGVGGTGSSFVITSFLQSSDGTELKFIETYSTASYETVNDSAAFITNRTSLMHHISNSASSLTTSTRWTYLIAGSLSMFVSIPLFIHYVVDRHSGRTATVIFFKEKVSLGNIRNPRGMNIAFVIGLFIVLNVILTGMIDTYAAFLTTFTINQLNWSHQAGALAVAVYFVPFSLGNITFAFSTLFLGLPTQKILVFSLVGTVLSFTGLTLSSIYLLDSGVWVFNASAGFMTAALWPAFFAHVEENVVSVAGMVGAVLLAAGAFGMLINPLIIGYTMEHLSPISFVYVMLIESIVVSGCFICFFFIYRDVRGDYDSC